MDIKFENNLDENIMKMTVTVQKRKTVSDEKIKLKWVHVEPLLEDYKCPNTHVLGRCLDPIQTLDNDIENKCSVTWTFVLEEKQTKAPKKKPTPKKAPTKSPKMTKKTSAK